MPVQARVSVTNHMANAGFFAPGPQQAGWPYTNAKYPQQPGAVWKTDNLTGDKDLYVDFGAPVLLEILIAVNVNYTQAQIFLDNDPSFAPANYATAGLTISRNRWARRHTFTHLFSPPQTQRYMIYRIPDAATAVDGSPYASTGGLWAGPLTALPVDFRWDERPQIIEPHIDIPLLGGGTQRVMTGRPYVEMRAQRLATVNFTTPASGDQLAAWLDLDDLMGNGRPCAWYFNRGNTAESFIFRKMNESDWNVHQVVSEDDLILHEVVGP